jgi:hypothetical protein
MQARERSRQELTSSITYLIVANIQCLYQRALLHSNCKALSTSIANTIAEKVHVHKRGADNRGK